MADFKVGISNLPAWRRAIVSVDERFKAELKGEFLSVGQRIADRIRGKVPTRSGAAAASVKARATAGGAAIVRGGTAAPYFPWLDFGGTVGRGHKPHVPGSGSIQRYANGGPWNPPGPGLYVYPTISEAQPETIRAVSELMIKVGRDAGFEVHGEMEVNR